MSIDAKQQHRNEHWSDEAVEYSEKWEKPDQEDTLYKDLEAQLMIEFTGAGEGKKILDLCSGTGRNTLALAKSGAQLWGLDGGQGMVDQARKNAAEQDIENATFECGDARSLPFSDGTFDAVTGTRFMYMMGPKEKRDIIREIHRVLKPSGIVVLQFNLGYWGIKTELIKVFRGKMPRIKHRYLWPGQIGRLFEGFRVEYFASIKFPKLGLVSRVTGEPFALRFNRITRWPIFRCGTQYGLVKAIKR